MAWPFARHIMDVDQRRIERAEILVETRLRRKSPPVSPPSRVLLINLSPLGFMARTDLRIIDGCKVSIELPILGEVRARAVWSMDRNVGAEFLRPIDPAIFDRVLEILKPVAKESD